MDVLITGGTGFLGRRLAAALLARGALPDGEGREREIRRLRLADVAEPPQPLPGDPRLEAVYGDFSEPGAAARLLSPDTGAVFHLAAVVSGQAEQEFDLGMRINFDGTRRLLDACRALARPPLFLFSSSVAVYGGDMPAVIGDDTQPVPQTSYGAQKAAGELLLGDYSRKGYVDGRALRLPTVVVRPGRPNAAASSFASSIVREPLQGETTLCPVPETAAMWVLSPRRVIASFLHTAAVPSAEWGAHRALSLPGLSVTVGETLAALRDIAGEAVAARVGFEFDPFVEQIVSGWPTRFAPARAQALGFTADSGVHEIIEAFIEDDLGGRYVA